MKFLARERVNLPRNEHFQVQCLKLKHQLLYSPYHRADTFIYTAILTSKVTTWKYNCCDKALSPIQQID